MNVFFTCKNTLVILLQLYRLYVVQSENKNKRKSEKYKKMETSNISIISRGDMYRDARLKSRDDKRQKRRRDKDVEANYTESEDSMEEIDQFDSSPRNVTHSKRRNRQDTGYSTSSSRNSGKQDRSEKREGKKKSTYKEETRRGISSDDERRKRRGDRKSSEKIERKSMKNKNSDSGKSSNRKYGSDNESDSEEITESKTISEGSESESDRKRYTHRKRRQDRD